ncbi:MAG: hypothetical protein KAJ12_15110 [Bacteroidetes bacterium]|nr:hypothetical protein [Bacteroidota bacterium]
MKKTISFGLMLIALNSSLLTSTARAKPDYCYVALRNCASNCMTGLPVFSEWCAVGCELGYLRCGTRIY